MTSIYEDALNLFDYTRSLRRDFHRFPELGFQENRTSAIITRELGSIGLDVKTGIGKTGVVALLEGGRPGPVILLRFDMDALPIQETTDVDFKSQNQGVMHACGHDGHIAVGLTTARILNNHRSEFAGKIKFIFQPAEEGLGGAESMISDGVLDKPKPDIALALHLWNEIPIGSFGITPGSMMAAGDIFHVRIHGKGGHGALPHLANDPVLTAVNVITTLQTIVSRNVSPLQTAVVSVTTINGGEAFNVIPPWIDLQGTIRTFEPQVRERVLEKFSLIVEGISSAMGCRAEIDVIKLTPAVINDARISGCISTIASQIFPTCIIDTSFRTMVSEDMAYILQDIPGCMFFIGSANSEKGFTAAHHHPNFNFDEQALIYATTLITSSAIRISHGL